METGECKLTTGESEMSTAKQKARDFLKYEQAFRLGALLTESSHPKTATLSQTIRQDVAEGIGMLLRVDEEIAPAAAKVFDSDAFERLVAAMTRALESGKRVFFTGCGATGRLSILLEAAWREFWQQFRHEYPDQPAGLSDLEDRVFSVMAGGDHALIQSVEGFEDHPRFGRYQLQEAGVADGDVVVAITEGGETPFVIGAAWQGLESGAEVFFVFNNPTEVLCRHVERSRQVLEEERITSLDLATGAMAVAGSTRMQATSSELLVVGAALESALKRLLQSRLPTQMLCALGCDPGQTIDYAAGMARLVRQLSEPTALDALVRLTQFEQQVYEHNGLVTYAGHDYLLDVLTDTTERAPTFRLPPFRKCDDRDSARSWAFVKNPLRDTRGAWWQILRRIPRGLEWTAETYRLLDAPMPIQSAPPALDNDQIYRFQIGNETDRSRFDAEDSAWVMTAVGEEVAAFAAPDHPFRREFDRRVGDYRQVAAVCVGSDTTDCGQGKVFSGGGGPAPITNQAVASLGDQVGAEHCLHGYHGEHGTGAWQLDGSRGNHEQEVDRPRHAFDRRVDRPSLRPRHAFDYTKPWKRWNLANSSPTTPRRRSPWRWSDWALRPSTALLRQHLLDPSPLGNYHLKTWKIKCPVTITLSLTRGGQPRGVNFGQFAAAISCVIQCPELTLRRWGEPLRVFDTTLLVVRPECKSGTQSSFVTFST